MKHEEEIRSRLISNTIQLIAEGGFEKATSKELTYYGEASTDFKMNEVYIYRFFGGKEALFEQAFLMLEYELYRELLRCSTEELAKDSELIKSWYRIFERSWSFLRRNEARCRCYVRYYYSIYFKGNSLAAHNRHFDEVTKVFEPIFREQANVSAIMHSVFSALLDFAIRSYNGELLDSEENRMHIFNILYNMLKCYLKDENARQASIFQ
jgi:AcrR family transcriptional regulator